MIGKRCAENFKIEDVIPVLKQVYPVASRKVRPVISQKFQALKATPDQVYYELVKLPFAGW